MSEPAIKHFYASAQSRYYLGDADQDGAPDFAVGKAVEFEVSACDPELGIIGKVIFGDGGEYSFSASACNQRIVLHAYSELQQDAVVLLDVKNEAGRSVIQAIKVDIVPLPPDEEAGGAAPLAAAAPPERLAQAPPSSPAPTGTTELTSTAAPAIIAPTDTSLAANVLKPGDTISRSAPPLAAQASVPLARSPLLGAFVTGVLTLLFIVILIYAIRTFFNRN